MDLHEQFEAQREQESQMCDELDCLLNRFAIEYAVSKFQLAAVLEQAKLRVLGFHQPSDEFFEAIEKLKEL
jgi:hypothetical protein